MACRAEARAVSRCVGVAAPWGRGALRGGAVRGTWADVRAVVVLIFALKSKLAFDSPREAVRARQGGRHHKELGRIARADPAQNGAVYANID